MSTASSYEGDMEYEKNSRSKVREVVYKCLKVFLREPIDGYDRSYTRTKYPDNYSWTIYNSDMIQMDIVAHVDKSCKLPSKPFIDIDNRLWTVVILKCSTKSRRIRKNKTTDKADKAVTTTIGANAIEQNLMITKAVVSAMETEIVKTSAKTSRRRNRRKKYKNAVATETAEATETTETIETTETTETTETIGLMKTLVRDSPEKAIKASVHLDSSKVTPMSKFKYVIGEVTVGTNKSLDKKIKQLEKDCVFMVSKATGISNIFPSKHAVSEVIAFLILIAPLENSGFVLSVITNNAKACPIVYQLFCEGKFVYIINKETTVEVVKQVKKDVSELRADVNELRADVNELRADVSDTRADVNELRAEIRQYKDETSKRFDETNKRFDETNKRLDDLFELVKNKL